MLPIILITVVAILFMWVLLGFIGFLIEAKLEKFTSFDKKTREEFAACIILGLFTFIYFVGCSFIKWFIYCMDRLLYKMNKR